MLLMPTGLTALSQQEHAVALRMPCTSHWPIVVQVFTRTLRCPAVPDEVLQAQQARNPSFAVVTINQLLSTNFLVAALAGS